LPVLLARTFAHHYSLVTDTFAAAFKTQYSVLLWRDLILLYKALKEVNMNSLTTEPELRPISFRAKVILVTLGTLAALAISIIALQLLPLTPKGTEFNSLADLRRALQAPVKSKSAADGVRENNASLRQIVLSHPDDSIIYTLQPNLDLTFMRARVRTNSCGMRSPERPTIKAPGVFRIALLGDSFAFGWGVDQKDTFAQKLEDNLNRIAAGRKRFEVLNFGVPGYSTFQEVALFEERGLDFSPDAVLVYFVQNDFGMPFFIRDIDGSGGIFSSMTFVQLGRKLLSPDSLNQQIAKLGLDPNKALSKLATLSQEHGIKTYLTINPRKSWRRDLSRLPAIKKDPNAQFIPLREGLLEYITRQNIPEKSLTLSFDPHPSEIRHNILGALLTPHFLEAASL